MRDAFLGAWRTESNPVAVERGRCSGSSELTGNHCGALHKQITLKPGESRTLIFMLGEGTREAGKVCRERYRDFAAVNREFVRLADFWERKLSKLEIRAPYPEMDTSINIWNLYQAEINVMFSRFASFIEVGGRTGLGFRDTAQDAICIPHSNPEKCRSRILELMCGLASRGYGVHLFEPAWFDGSKPPNAFRSPTVIPRPKREDVIHSAEDACSDDAFFCHCRRLGGVPRCSRPRRSCAVSSTGRRRPR